MKEIAILSKTAINKMNYISNSNIQDSGEPKLPKNWQEFWEHLTGYEANKAKREIAKRSDKPWYAVVGKAIRCLSKKSGSELRNNLAWLALARVTLRIGIDIASGATVNILWYIQDSANFTSERVTDNPIFKDVLKICIAIIFNSVIPQKKYVAFLEIFGGLHDMVLHGLPAIFTVNIIQNNAWWHAWLVAFVMLCPIMAFLYFRQLDKNPIWLTGALFLLYLILIVLAYQGLLPLGTYEANHHYIKLVKWDAAIFAAFFCFFLLFGGIQNMCCFLKGWLQVLKF